MTAPRAITWVLCLWLAAPAAAADLQEHTARAFDGYLKQARRTFLERIAGVAADGSKAERGAALRDAEVMAGPAAEDGIIAVPGGLVHHWIGSTFIPGASLQDVLAVSYAYDEYHAVYTPVSASRLLGREGNTYRVLLRIGESGAGLSAILDVTARVQYAYPHSRSVYSTSVSDEIREVRNAGKKNEYCFSPGHDSGYLWRAATFTHFLQMDSGVLVEMEAIGLSRGFPSLLRWISGWVGGASSARSRNSARRCRPARDGRQFRARESSEQTCRTGGRRRCRNRGGTIACVVRSSRA
jgi:hypothetical protein